MAVALFFGGLILIFIVSAIVSNWWEERTFRNKLKKLMYRFGELDESTLINGEEAIKKLDEVTATIQGNIAYQEHLLHQQSIRRKVNSFKRKYKKR
jgi:hypothetical protein